MIKIEVRTILGVMTMPLNVNDQISVLTDILQNHKIDCCGTISECEQIERIIQSVIQNEHLNFENKQMLLDIYQYGQKGKGVKSLDNHIATNQDNISQWIDNLHINTLI